MSGNKAIVGVFAMPQEFPCGEGSTCCGPVGQSEGEIAALRSALANLEIEVEVHDVRSCEIAQNHPNVFQLFRSFGPTGLPILTVAGEVVCMSNGSVEECVKAVEQKLLHA